MKARGVLEIDSERFKKNLLFYSKIISPKKIIAVIKADAYGLGIENISKILADLNIKQVAVIEIDAAIRLKKQGFDVFVLGNPFPEDLEELIENNLKFCVSSQEILDAISKVKSHNKAKLILEFDTGMGRLGFLEIPTLPNNVELIGLMSHLSSAGEDPEYTSKQIQEFKKILNSYDNKNLEIHLANSDGFYNYPELYQGIFTHIRIGISMYGISNFGESRECVKLMSNLIQVRNLPAGFGIGYDKTYILPKDTLVGTIPLGYADGIPMQLKNAGSVKISGKLCRIIGKVSMDFITVDLAEVDLAKPGDLVELLWDKQSFDSWASLKGTHYYDILCSIGKRVLRKVI